MGHRLETIQHAIIVYALNDIITFGSDDEWKIAEHFLKLYDPTHAPRKVAANKRLLYNAAAWPLISGDLDNIYTLPSGERIRVSTDHQGQVCLQLCLPHSGKVNVQWIFKLSQLLAVYLPSPRPTSLK